MTSRRRFGQPARATAVEGRSAWWPVRVGRWIAERHGLGVLAPVVVLFALSFSVGALQLEEDLLFGRPVHLFAIVLGGAAFWSWYLMLRALDDLQDAAADAVAHPGRMLARGAISRRDLWLLAGAAVLVQGVVSVMVDAESTSLTVTFTWLAMLGFLLVAAVDFALPRFVTEERPWLLPILRSPASILPVCWAYAMGSADRGPTAAPISWSTLALAGIALFTVAIIEVTRRLPVDPAGRSRPRGVVYALILALLASCSALLLLEDLRWPGVGIGLVIVVIVVVIVVGAIVQARSEDQVKPAATSTLGLLLLTTAAVIGAAW